MKVKLIYRNYRPLHSMFLSTLVFPPKGVEIDAPKKNKILSQPIFFRIYRKYGQKKPIKFFITSVISPFFARSTKKDSYDIYHYINIIPSKHQNKPYLVEFEHAGALLDFLFEKDRATKVINCLKNPNCKAIVCATSAAKKSLVDLAGKDYVKLENKVKVVYPALDHKVRKQNNSAKQLKSYDHINLLFVGNDAYRKGFEETIEALKRLNKDISKKINFLVISNDAKEIINKNHLNNLNVKFYKPEFDKSTLIERFFSKSDILLFPTKQDTFGYVLLDAMSAGLPVISTKQFAVPEIIKDGYNGLLLELDKPILDNYLYLNQEILDSVSKSNFDENLCNNIKNALERVMQDSNLLKRLQNNSINFFDKHTEFTAKHKSEELLKIYRSMVQR